MRRWGPNGPAEVMPALSHGWWKGWRGPKPLTADFGDRGRGFNVLSVLVADDFGEAVAVGADRLDLLGGFNQRRDAGRRVGFVGILHGYTDDGARLEIDGMLGFV